MNNIHRRIKMFDTVRNRAGFASSFLTLTLGFGLLFSVTACNKKENPESAQAAPKTFASPDEAGKALVDAAKSQNQDAVLAIFGPGSAAIISTGNPAEDKAALNGFAQDYQVMNRWRKLGDGSELLLVGANNQAFPIPLMKNASGQWYFDAASGKEEILARRIGRDELAAIDVCAALADSQAQYFSQRHGGVKQYAQKFIAIPASRTACTGSLRRALLAARLDHLSHSLPRRDSPPNLTPPSPSMAITSGGWTIRVPLPRAARRLISSMER